MARNPLRHTRLPLWLVLLLTGVTGAVAVLVLYYLYFVIQGAAMGLADPFGSLLIVLVFGLFIAGPAGVLVSLGGIAGAAVGRSIDRRALGAAVGALVVTIVPPLLLMLTGSQLLAGVDVFLIIGGALAALVFFFEARWHHAATETPVAA